MCGIKMSPSSHARILCESEALLPISEIARVRDRRTAAPRASTCATALASRKAKAPRRPRASIWQFCLPIECAKIILHFGSYATGAKTPETAWPVRQETALDSAPRSPNGFLSSLTADDFELIRPHLRTADLSQDMVLIEVDETLKRAYLPHKGVISLVVKLARGEHVQIAMIGRDSIFGAFSALGDAIAMNTAEVLVPGTASTIDLDQLRFAADQSATLRTALVRHGLAVYAQIQQTAGCNASHTVESRLARCLVHTRDLAGSDKLVLTQEAMAQMIGARRNSVSLVANTLQQANFIHYSRGHIEITNVEGLIRTSCECYATVKSQYTRLLHPRIHCAAA